MACSLSYSLTGLTGDCQSLNQGAFSVSINGTAPPYTIEWMSPFTDLIPLGSGVSEYSRDSLSAGTYQFKITDACDDPENLTIIATVHISSGFCVNISGITNTTCNTKNGSLTANTAYDYGNYSWRLFSTTMGYITSATTDNSLTPHGVVFSSLEPGTYYVDVIDDGGCSGRTESVIIGPSTTLTYELFIVNDSSCTTDFNTGKVIVNNIVGKPPYSFLWKKDDTILDSTTNAITGLTEGSYSVTVSDSSGCVTVQSANVIKVEPMSLAGVYPQQPSCFGSDGELTIVMQGGTSPFTFSGSNGVILVTFQNYVTFDTLPGGTFGFFVQDSGLCKFSDSITLQTPKSFLLTSITTKNSTCGGAQGEITISVTSGTPPYTFKVTSSDNVVDNSVAIQSPSYTFSGLKSDTYTITITDGGPCTYTTTREITNQVNFEYEYVVNTSTCGLSNGSVEINVITGVGDFTYEINTGEIVTLSESTHTFNNLSSGNYVISVTDNDIPCKITESIYIPGTSKIEYVSSFVNPTDCNNGLIQIFIVDGIPPYTITWSDNVNGQTGLSVNNLSAGTYTVNVTDNSGCFKQKTITLTGGICCSLSYELFEICESDFNNTGKLLTKNPLLMLKEGFADLTMGDENCVLNKAIFEAVTNVSGVTASTVFYTGYTLTDVPSDELFADTVRTMLLNYDGIGTVTIDTTKNKIVITTDCASSSSLLDTVVSVSLVIHYDISCVSCAT
jgi:uncharacterized protein (DUF2141 family)